MARNEPNCRRRISMAAVLGLLMLAFAPPALALAPAPVVGVGPLAPGMARIWIYREYEPYQSLARPYVRLNGAIVAISEPGGAFYRDVAPGTYLVTVDSDGMDVNQFVTIGVGAGQQVFVKVLTDKNWDSGGGGGGRNGGGGGGWQRDTFYTWQIQPQAAEAEIAQMPLYNGS